MNAINHVLINWYQNNKRDLSIRKSRNPYEIWLSEVILQQTRMEQGIPYFDRFLAKFPTVQALASASENQVLRLWQGLGYYSRARNLHKTAKIVSTKFNGRFPKSSNELLHLPGIGPYTAAAIASFSFKEVVAVVDGNVQRILTRLYAIEEDIRSSKTQKLICELAHKHIDRDQPDIYNHAIMDFGSLVCKPKPDCANCPLSNHCLSYVNNLQNKIPFKSSSAKKRDRYFTYLILKFGNSLALKKRGSTDIWANLYDFYLVEGQKLQEIHTVEAPILKGIEIKNISQSIDFKQVLSHQIIHARFLLVDTIKKVETKELSYFFESAIQNLPKPVLIDNYLKDYFNSTIQIDTFNNPIINEN